MSSARLAAAAVVVAAVVVVTPACGGGRSDRASPTTTAPTETAAPTSTVAASVVPTAEAPATTSTAAPNAVEVDFAAALVELEQAIADPATPPEDLATAARRQQLAYRAWSGHPEWDQAVLELVPPELTETVRLHLDARRAFLGMATRSSDLVPAWEIVEPAPADELLADHHEAEAATGVEWEYLAAINLVETGMGRIRGLSTAGAQGPMQFLPSTFAEWSEGGDINDPRDAILAAGRFLADKGAPGDMAAALYRYNNHDNYVAAVSAYATIMRDNPHAYEALHAWEVQYLSTAGDLWLPVGYRSDVPVPVADYVAARPDAITGPVPPQVAASPPH